VSSNDMVADMPDSPRLRRRASTTARRAIARGALSSSLLALGLLSSADVRANEAGVPPSGQPAPASASTTRSGFRCDGQDAFFFRELEAAGTVGYGETWDSHICDEGVSIYAPGVTSRWPDWKAKPRAPTKEEQMYAMLMPVVAMGLFVACFGLAALIALVARTRRDVVLAVPCPKCSAELPIAVGDQSARAMFCPMCGAACAIDVRGRGRSASAVARALA